VDKDWKADISTSIKTYFMEVKGWSQRHYDVLAPKISLVVSLYLFLKGKRGLGNAIKDYVAL